MTSYENPPPVVSQEQKMANLVQLIIDTSIKEAELHRSLNQPAVQVTYPRISRTRLAVPDYEDDAVGQLLLINDSKIVINHSLLSIGGIKCRYDDRDTGQAVTSRFIEWIGIDFTQTGIHMWRPIHKPDSAITVPATFLDSLKQKYGSEEVQAFRSEVPTSQGYL